VFALTISMINFKTPEYADGIFKRNSVYFYQATRCHIPAGRVPASYVRRSLKSQNVFVYHNLALSSHTWN